MCTACINKISSKFIKYCKAIFLETSSVSNKFLVEIFWGKCIQRLLHFSLSLSYCVNHCCHVSPPIFQTILNSMLCTWKRCTHTHTVWLNHIFADNNNILVELAVDCKPSNQYSPDALFVRSFCLWSVVAVHLFVCSSKFSCLLRKIHTARTTWTNGENSMASERSIECIELKILWAVATAVGGDDSILSLHSKRAVSCIPINASNSQYTIYSVHTDSHTSVPNEKQKKNFPSTSTFCYYHMQ